MPLLFSYGTLQREEVQRATFGRALRGEADALVGFALSTFEVTDPAFVAESGSALHRIVRETGRDDDRVSGTALEVTDDELARADAYEPAGYARVRARLASGREAWVYAQAG
jgi:hypothetical protein